MLTPCVGKTGKDDDDSVSGLMRFLIAHFAPVVNKLLPEGSPAEIARLIESDEYFNKLTFDEIVLALVNVLVLLARLFREHVERTDEKDQPQLYSKLLGLHTLPWEPDAWESYVKDFNQCSDKVRHAQAKVKTRVDASKLSKDKTRLLQFVPTVDLLEKTIKLLLPSDLSPPQINALTPEVRCFCHGSLARRFGPHCFGGFCGFG